MQTVPTVSLNNGANIGSVGFGLYKVPLADSAHLTGLALEAGYRTLDTAALYANEEGVGQGVRAATEEWLDREDIFVTSKVWNDRHGYNATLAAFDESMDKLGLDYLDLYLVHWPCPDQDLYIPTYKALEKLYHDGRVRAIGVSNFEPEHLDRLLQETDVVPALNQIELHPWLQQRELRTLHEAAGIRTQAWSPLARGQLLEDPVLTSLAQAHSRSVAQIVLRWHHQCGVLSLPKASSAGRIAENIDIFDFTLSTEEMDAVAGLDRGHRSGSNPVLVG
ncbi:aldo/keto reductase [Arthrobacter sp. 35W]|uniref:aldo/keto reductase n=1 Tax=Arthrobacter sp. 35W TaxID=1132441 RepID=UPI0004214363|nr:aldo/keto reductase [Arthrobacter sp. 35W]